MNILERIQNAPDDAQVSILFRAGEPGAARGGEDIFSVKELRSALGMVKKSHFYPSGERHIFETTCPCGPRVNDVGVIHRSYGGTD